VKRRARFWIIVAVTVVCVGLVGSSGLLIQRWYWRASSDPEFFAADIAKFATIDREHPPPERPVVFVGSSSIRLWDTLEQDMAPLAALNRGFGGAQLASVVYFADRVVIQYRPRAVVLYAGDNDIDAGRSPEDVARDFGVFVSRVQTALPDARIYYVSMKPSRQLWRNWPKYERANAQIAAICARDPRLAYLDVATPMLASGRPPARSLFKFDGMHPSAEGYALWTGIIKLRLHQDF